MTEHQNHPNPDDRSDNVEKLQQKVQDTIENIEAAHDTMKFASSEEKEKKSRIKIIVEKKRFLV